MNLSNLFSSHFLVHVLAVWGNFSNLVPYFITERSSTEILVLELDFIVRFRAYFRFTFFSKLVVVRDICYSCLIVLVNGITRAKSDQDPLAERMRTQSRDQETHK